MRSQIAASESRSWVTMTTVKAETLLQPADKPVESGGADRIEAGGGFVEEEDVRIERQGPCEAGTFAHAAG